MPRNYRPVVTMMAILTSPLNRLLSQEVARSNAAHEARRLQHSRRQLDDINAFLAAHHDDSQRGLGLLHLGKR